MARCMHHLYYSIISRRLPPSLLQRSFPPCVVSGSDLPRIIVGRLEALCANPPMSCRYEPALLLEPPSIAAESLTPTMPSLTQLRRHGWTMIMALQSGDGHGEKARPSFVSYAGDLLHSPSPPNPMLHPILHLCSTPSDLRQRKSRAQHMGVVLSVPSSCAFATSSSDRQRLPLEGPALTGIAYE